MTGGAADALPSVRTHWEKIICVSISRCFFAYSTFPEDQGSSILINYMIGLETCYVNINSFERSQPPTAHTALPHAASRVGRS